MFLQVFYYYSEETNFGKQKCAHGIYSFKDVEERNFKKPFLKKVNKQVVIFSIEYIST